jgi:hypothetical protein
MDNNYGNQYIFLEWRTKLLTKVINKIKNGNTLKEVMSFIALERHQIALEQLSEKKKVHSIEDTDITNFNKNKLLLFSLKKNALTADEKQEYDKLCFIKHQESSSYSVNFGQVRCADFNDYGVPLHPEAEETVEGTPNCSLVYHKKISENKADYTDKIKIQIDVLPARRRRMGNRMVKRNSEQKTVEHYTVLWNDCELTKISANRFVHTDKKYFAPIIDQVSLLYETLPTLTDKTLVQRNINQMYWLLIHAMIYFRGNASITEIFIECLYKIYDIKAQCVASVVLLGNPDIDCLNTVKNDEKRFDLAFYTYFYGGNNNIAFTIPKIPSFKYKCYYYTNNKSLYDMLQHTHWISIFVDKPTKDDVKTTTYYEQKSIESCMAGKHIKAVPEDFQELKEHDYLCFLDSKLDKINDAFIEQHIQTYFIEKNYALLLREHPFIKNSVWQEYEVSMHQERYRLESQSYKTYINNQLNTGLKDEINQHCTTNLLLRNMKHEKINDLNNTWYAHIQECGIQCQISFFFVKQLFDDCIFPFAESPFIM